MAENVASLDPLTVHGHGDAGKLSLYLERFVAIFLDLPVLLDQLEAAAKDGPFLSRDDLRTRSKLSKTVIDFMGDLGLLGDLPESNQLSLFDFA
mgnify:CR=1 FL=1